MTDESYVIYARARLAEAKQFLERLKSGKLHIGDPLDGRARTEAKMHQLRRQIAEYEAILEKKRCNDE